MSGADLIAGRYHLLELAGRGGMAEVWRAEQRGAAGFARPVGLKRILPHLAAKQAFVTMFVEEARVCAQLVHPNIVQIYDFGYDQGTYFIVMEWVEGLNLYKFLKSYQDRKSRAPWPVVVAILLEALKGLQAAHERVDHGGYPAPVIHRDVTPPNILVGLNGVVKLSDFGLARAMDRLRMTDPETVKGKVAYLAPELTRGSEASARTDLYALGVTAWQALAGRRLFAGDTDAAIFLAAREANVPDLADERGDLPPPLCAIVMRALARRAEERFESAEHMRGALTQLLRTMQVRTDPSDVAKEVASAREAMGIETVGHLGLPMILE
jgi:serine/threonine-protein kinase